MRCDIGGQFLAILIPWREPLVSFCKSNLDSTSVNKIKRNGEMGSPWRKPRLEVKKPSGDPLIKMKYEGMEMHWLIIWIHFSEKPNCLKMESKKDHSTLSKAFSKSMFRAANPKEPVRFWWRVWKILCAMIELSWMFLPGIEVACHGVMSLGRRLLRRLAKVLEIIL